MSGARASAKTKGRKARADPATPAAPAPKGPGLWAELRTAEADAWWVPVLALPAAATFAVIAEADAVSKQYAEMIHYIDRCPFYTRTSGLVVALSHKYYTLARVHFPNDNFPTACVHAFYSPLTRRLVQRHVDRFLPRLYTRALPEHGGLTLSPKELVASVMREVFTDGARGPDAAELDAALPCPVPPPVRPLYVAWALAVGCGALGATAIATSRSAFWRVAFVVGALVGVILAEMRRTSLKSAFAQYEDLCVAIQQ